MKKVTNANEADEVLNELFGVGTVFNLTELQVTDLMRKTVDFAEKNKELRTWISEQYNNKNLNTKEAELGLEVTQYNQHNFTGWAIGSKLAAWIATNIPQGSKVLEFGSGTGSHELGKFYQMHCVEHDEQWLNKFDNINYYHAPIVNNWYTQTVLEKLPTDYNLLIIDGPPGRIGRSGILDHLGSLNLNVPIVIDDVERKAEYAIYVKIKEFVKYYEEVMLTENNKQTIVLLPKSNELES